MNIVDSFVGGSDQKCHVFDLCTFLDEKQGKIANKNAHASTTKSYHGETPTTVAAASLQLKRRIGEDDAPLKLPKKMCGAGLDGEY